MRLEQELERDQAQLVALKEICVLVIIAIKWQIACVAYSTNRSCNISNSSSDNSSNCSCPRHNHNLCWMRRLPHRRQLPPRQQQVHPAVRQQSLWLLTKRIQITSGMLCWTLIDRRHCVWPMWLSSHLPRRHPGSGSRITTSSCPSVNHPLGNCWRCCPTR